MSHEVTQMFYVGATPWHGLGTELPGEITCMDALAAAGLDWEVMLKRMYTENGLVEGFRAVERQGDLPVLSSAHVPAMRHLGVVSETWGPVQNAELAGVGDALAGEGNAYCHTAGSLRGGQWVWFLLKLPQQIRVKGDESPIEQYLLLSNRHDGSMTLRLAFTPIRVVCANTARFAIEGAQDYVAIKHTANVGDRLADASEAIKSAMDFYSRFDELANRLADERFTHGQMVDLSEHLYPSTIDADTDALSLIQAAVADKEPKADALDLIAATLKSKGLTPATQAKRDELQRLFVEGTGFTDSMRGTAWAALQAVSEHTDHGREFKDSKNHSAEENRFQNVLFGDGAKLQTKALDRIGKMVDLDIAA